jgi:hypothetical protein
MEKRITNVDSSVSRFNIYENGKLIGQNYKSGSGKWMHKWYFKGSFERGGCSGLAKGENDINWIYEPINEN